MTFIEAAIEVLRQAGKPLHVKELTERAVRLKLLTHVGRSPDATMQARLMQESRKGDRSPLVNMSAGVFALRRPARPAKTAPATPLAEAGGEIADQGAAKRKRRRRGRGRKDTVGAAPGGTLAGAEAPPAPDTGAVAAPGATAAAAAETSIDLDAFQHRQRPRFGALEIPSADEYATEVAQHEGPLVVDREVSDAQAADEDRPMLAAIEAQPDRGRRRRGGERRSRKDEKAGRRPRAKEEPTQGAKATRAAPQAARPAPPIEARERRAEASGGAGGLADVASQLLRALGDARPVPARQLADMALKRKLVAGDPESVARAFRAALLDDGLARQARGLRPRVKHHGGNLFGVASQRLEPELAQCEEALAVQATRIADETRACIRRRLMDLPLPALEQLVRMLLERTGLGDITTARREGGAVHLHARARRGAISVGVLVSVLSGAGAIGGDAVADLRAEVLSAGLDEGMLACVGKIGGEAEREARGHGPPLTVLDGEALAEEILRTGVGILRVAMPIAYLDVDFFAELAG